ncbi:MAG: methyltransferase domain-containing protein [Ginsengibacter sp.]
MVFGLDRGTPIDRYYIEGFLNNHRALITGHVLEVAESHYSRKFGTDVASFEVLHFNNENPRATIIGDLTDKRTLPANTIDCFICTQTFQFIYNYKDAIRGAHQLLKKNGVLLATIAGISQVSRYDMDRWGDYWRFTTLSAAKSFGDVFGENQVTVNCFGNVLSTVAFLEGISAEELTADELNYKDDNYQMLITILARK